MKVKTADLIGPALDWAVAVADKRIILRTLCKDIVVRGRRADGSEIFDDSYSFTPSVSWSQGGPIIEQGEIELLKWSLDGWAARDTNYQFLNTPQEHPYFAEGYGPTPLIAACRCRVASKLGDEVDIPEELLK